MAAKKLVGKTNAKQAKFYHEQGEKAKKTGDKKTISSIEKKVPGFGNKPAAKKTPAKSAPMKGGPGADPTAKDAANMFGGVKKAVAAQNTGTAKTQAMQEKRATGDRMAKKKPAGDMLSGARKSDADPKKQANAKLRAAGKPMKA